MISVHVYVLPFEPFFEMSQNTLNVFVNTCKFKIFMKGTINILIQSCFLLSEYFLVKTKIVFPAFSS